MHSPKRIKITDVNPHLICVLCGGYYIDATTIIECLHSFCKSCIVRYLQKNKYCPICDVQVHKSAPLLNIRSDKTLQNIVYKLVPSLFKNEMERRIAFYEKYPGAMPLLPEQRGEVTDTTPIFFPDELLIICLEYQNDHRMVQGTNNWPKRYLHCPAAVTVSHLVKLIKGKFNLTNIHQVSLFFKDDLLEDDITIMDIAYTYQCRRKAPIHLMYRILELKKKTIRLMPPIPPSRIETPTLSGVVDKKEQVGPMRKDEQMLANDGKRSTNVGEGNERQQDAKEVGKVHGETKIELVKEGGSDVASTVVESMKTKPDGVEINSISKDVEDGNSGDKNTLNNNNGEENSELVEKVKADLSGGKTEAELKEVQLQISENGVMSVRNMKNSECSPIPAVEAPSCPVSHPTSTTAQASPSVTSNKMTFTTVGQSRSTAEPIVSVSKVSKDQVKKDVNHSMSMCENKLSISRVSSPGAANPVAKGDVLNRIVSKLSPNETAIGNTGVTIRPVTKVYPGMKSVQERKNNRPSSNHLQSKYKSVNQSPTWNPTIDRTTMLSLKQNCDLNKPPRFFKMRNTPRYLGNPAEGVKPMYGGGRLEGSPPKQTSPKSPAKQPPPYSARGQDKPPPPYTPRRPTHPGCATYLPPNPYHLLYSGFPFAGASPELLRSMCASTAYHPSLPPSISMLYNNPVLQQSASPTPQRSQPPPPPSPHDFNGSPTTPPSIQRVPSSLSPKPLPLPPPPPPLPPPSVEIRKRDLPHTPASSSTSSLKPLQKSLEDKPPPSLPPPPVIPLPPPPIPIADKSSSTSLTINNNTKESPLSSPPPAPTNQRPLK